MPYLQYGKLNYEPYPRNGIDANGERGEGCTPSLPAQHLRVHSLRAAPLKVALHRRISGEPRLCRMG